MEILTLQKLKDMKPGAIIRVGVGLYPEFHETIIKWVAKCGGVYDWAIYYASPEMEVEYVTSYGDKVHTESMIRQFVPCTNEAFDKYRH